MRSTQHHKQIFNLVPRVSHLTAPWSERRVTLVGSGHVPPRIWEVANIPLKEGAEGSMKFVYTESTGVQDVLSPKQTIWRYVPICCSAAMSGDNILQTPKITYTSSVIGKQSCCRLCGLVKDISHCKNLFKKANEQLLATAKAEFEGRKEWKGAFKCPRQCHKLWRARKMERLAVAWISLSVPKIKTWAYLQLKIFSFDCAVIILLCGYYSTSFVLCFMMNSGL